MWCAGTTRARQKLDSMHVHEVLWYVGNKSLLRKIKEHEREYMVHLKLHMHMDGTRGIEDKRKNSMVAMKLVGSAFNV